jgi:CBS domain containing-hemolysin-like protein
MMLRVAWIALLVFLMAAGAVASYLRLLLRRLTAVSARRLFVPVAESRIQVDRERVGVSISTIHGVTMHVFAVGVTALLMFTNPQHFWENIGVALLIVLGVVAILDQLIPFLLVVRHDDSETVLESWMPLLHASLWIALPLTFPILVSATIKRLLVTPEEKEAETSPQEDFQQLIEAGEQEGLIQKGEGKLLQAVVEFGGKQVRDVMTPRTEIAAVEISSSIESLRELFRQKRYTRYPVYIGKLDAVEGIVNFRDLMELPPDRQKEAALRDLVKPAKFVPVTKPTRELLKELQRSTDQIAMVIDEYGSVSGMVTIEDLVEEIVGEIRDEVEPHERDVVRETATSYIISGHADLEVVNEHLHAALDGKDFSTLAGLVLAELGHVPLLGERFEKDGLIFEILEANQRTVLKVRVRSKLPADTTMTAHARTTTN